MRKELAFIFFYVGAFGISDYVVRYFNLEHGGYLLYYALMFLIGFILYKSI